MNTLYLQMNTHTLLNNSPLTRPSCRMIKRIFDIITALIVLILFFPWVYLIIACCIKIWMPGPIFFKQSRTGKNGKVFICYKFRTMDARNSSDEFVDPQINQYSLGNFLRMTSIDELPQFWNVLKGDMSIIGPRPHMLVHDEEYTSKIKEYSTRYAVKPGITGWAQVNGLRGERDIERVQMRVNYDLWYIQHWSLSLDIKIMFRTIGVMIKK
ncbi:sugar transferase [Bacteroides nordii]|uniref:sugar transferase n=1 Tax=Bacteroides nordii TaxID=291645 RepID=UPI00242FC5FD|nr:sugar transferase [Bacteroides nordii]